MLCEHCEPERVGHASVAWTLSVNLIHYLNANCLKRNVLLAKLFQSPRAHPRCRARVRLLYSVSVSLSFRDNGVECY